MQKVYYFHQSVAAGQRLTQEGAEVFARYAVQLGHQKQSLRAYKVGRWIAPGIAAAVRAADVLEHSEKPNFYFVVEFDCAKMQCPTWRHCRCRRHGNDVKALRQLDWLRLYWRNWSRSLAT